MITTRLVRFLCPVFALWLNTAAAFAQEMLSGASREVVVDSRALVHGPIPEWDRGLFLARDIWTEPGRVIVSDRNGNIVRELKLRFPDTRNITIADTAVSADGDYALSGGATDNDGTLLTFIAWLDQAGNTTRIVRTSPYSPRRIVFADDGTLWVVGRGPRQETGHDTLRRYGADGVRIESFLPRSTFNSQLHPTSSVFLMTSGDGIGVYSATAMEWVELSSSDGTVQRWAGADFPGRFRVTGVGVTSSGSVYVSVQHKIEDPPEGTTETDITRIHRLDRSTGAWVGVELGDSNTGHIFGAEGEELVVTTSYATFRWVKVP